KPGRCHQQKRECQGLQAVQPEVARTRDRLAILVSTQFVVETDQHPEDRVKREHAACTEQGGDKRVPAGDQRAELRTEHETEHDEEKGELEEKLTQALERKLAVLYDTHLDNEVAKKSCHGKIAPCWVRTRWSERRSSRFSPCIWRCR